MRSFNGGNVLALTALVLPTLIVFTSKGAAPLFVVAAVAAAVAAVISPGSFRNPPLWLLTLLGAFLLWGFASCFWAVAPLESLYKAGQLSGVFISGLILLGVATGLVEPERRRVRQGLLAGALLCLVVVVTKAAINPAFDTFLHGLTTRTATAHYLAGANFLFMKSLSETMCLLLWPTAVAASGQWGRRGLWATIGTFLVFILFMQSYSALATLSAGLVTFILARRFFKTTVRVLMIGILLGFIAAPIVAAHMPAPPSAQERPWNLPLSLVHRVYIWRFTAHHIAEKPITGWGLDSSRDIPGGREEVKMYALRPDNSIFVNATGEIMPLHPHNALLQLWLELGLPGAALTALLLILSASRTAVAFPDQDDRAAALAALVTALVIGLVSFGVFQSWWMGILWLTAIFLRAVARPPSEV